MVSQEFFAAVGGSPNISLVGDLAYHITRKQQKNERFTEDEIFNWFVQTCMALAYMHSKNVIHRDIKT